MLVRAASAFAVTLLLAACTQSGQFDPTEILASDVLNTKKKIQGEREPLFPSGVPGAETGVPPDLVKGYQAPQQAAPETTESVPKPAAAAAEAKAKQKPKPRPKVARAPATAPAPAAQDPVWGGGQRSAAPPQQQQHDPAWDQKSPQQSAWPAPQSAAPAQQTAQPAQSVWPNPPAAPNTSTR